MDRPVKHRRRLPPLPIQVHAGQAASIVANDDAVGVKHGNNLPHEVLPQHMSLRVGRQQEIQQPMHQPRGIRFARVHPRRRNTDSLARPCLPPVGDGKQVALDPTLRLAQALAAHVLRLARMTLDLRQQCSQHGIRVRKAVREKNGVSVSAPAVGETQGVEVGRPAATPAPLLVLVAFIVPGCPGYTIAGVIDVRAPRPPPAGQGLRLPPLAVLQVSVQATVWRLVH
mmetsp:Transcript_104611/g.239774  ORF Transcript_104611/g.239774 Transcript_104611/m.239774 type:complete len:227 (+) Transcript_104611:3085-3765(+)